MDIQPPHASGTKLTDAQVSRRISAGNELALSRPPNWLPRRRTAGFQLLATRPKSHSMLPNGRQGTKEPHRWDVSAPNRPPEIVYMPSLIIQARALARDGVQPDRCERHADKPGGASIRGVEMQVSGYTQRTSQAAISRPSQTGLPEMQIRRRLSAGNGMLDGQSTARLASRPPASPSSRTQPEQWKCMAYLSTCAA